MNAETTMREALVMALEWIDAVPKDMPLPTMPGFDRDWVNGLLAATARTAGTPKRWEVEVAIDDAMSYARTYDDNLVPSR